MIYDPKPRVLYDPTEMLIETRHERDRASLADKEYRDIITDQIEKWKKRNGIEFPMDEKQLRIINRKLRVRNQYHKMWSKKHIIMTIADSLSEWFNSDVIKICGGKRHIKSKPTVLSVGSRWMCTACPWRGGTRELVKELNY